MVTGCRVGAGPAVSCETADFSFVVRHELQSALDALHRDFFNLVVLDLREPVHGRLGRSGDFEEGIALLDAMDGEPDIERRYGFHRILALVSGRDPAELDRRIAMLAARGVGRVMRDLSECRLHEGCRFLPSKPESARTILDEMIRLTLHRQVGKLALCASGGGITGLYFELGAMKCLEDCCSPGALNGCDLYFGISSGASPSRCWPTATR